MGKSYNNLALHPVLPFLFNVSSKGMCIFFNYDDKSGMCARRTCVISADDGLKGVTWCLENIAQSLYLHRFHSSFYSVQMMRENLAHSEILYECTVQCIHSNPAVVC